MSLETTLQPLLAACAAGGAYQDIAPQNLALAPFIVWSEITSTANNTLQGASNIQNTRIQVDVYAKTQASRATVVAAVIAAMASAALSNVQVTSANSYEQETKLFRAIIDFSVWSS